MATSTWTCANCEGTIGKLEDPKEWCGHLVCPSCYARLAGQSQAKEQEATPPPQVRVVGKQRPAKSLPFAIGLNILLPGVGYMYMGRIVLGIVGMLLILGAYAITPTFTLFYTWAGINAIVALDMVILANNRRKR